MHNHAASSEISASHDELVMARSSSKGGPATGRELGARTCRAGRDHSRPAVGQWKEVPTNLSYLMYR